MAISKRCCRKLNSNLSVRLRTVDLSIILLDRYIGEKVNEHR